MKFERVGNDYKVVKYELQDFDRHLHSRDRLEGDAYFGTIAIPSEHNGKPVISIDDLAFSGCSGDLKAIVIPNTITSIGKSAFAGCKSLTSIAIPDSVISIGDYAFRGCASLKSITVNPNNHNYASRDGILYERKNARLIHVPAAITGKVTIPHGVTRIDNCAFSNCENLTSITIPASVTSIGASAFLYCTRLESIVYNGTKIQWDKIQKGECWIDLGKRIITVSCKDEDVTIFQKDIPAGNANKSLRREMATLSIFWIPVIYLIIGLILNLLVKGLGLFEIKNETLYAILLFELPLDRNNNIIKIVEPIIGIAILACIGGYYFAVFRSIRNDFVWKKTVKKTEPKTSYQYQSTIIDSEGRKINEYKRVESGNIVLLLLIALGLTFVFPIYAIWRMKKNPA